MSDSLTVAGGGSRRVTTTAITDRSAQLDTLLTEALQWAGCVLDARYTTPGVGGSLAASLETLSTTLIGIENDCATLSRKLDEAALGYGEAEERARRFAQSTSGGSDLLGAVLAQTKNLATPPVLLLAPLLMRAMKEHGLPPAGADQQEVWRYAEELLRSGELLRVLGAAVLSQPAIIAAIRMLVETTDRRLLAAVGLPWVIARTLLAHGKEGGAEATVATLVWLARVRSLAHPPARTAIVATPLPEVTRPARAPGGFRELYENMPTAALSPEAQIGVQRIGDEYVVYVAGTTDFGSDPEQPFDMTSNLLLVADETAPAELATLAAMDRAGVPRGASVTFIGHSQGGMVAARIALSGRYDVHDVVNLGGPIRQMDLPESTRVLSVEHTQDPVPATGGLPRAPEDEPQVIRASRDLDPAELAVTDTGPMPGHSLRTYGTTTGLLDGSTDERVMEMKEQLFGRFTGEAGPVAYFAVSGEPVAKAAPPLNRVRVAAGAGR
ncbi:hypothetical protein HQQ80_12460 [Microbacteriaceae bacterium VKM Ac-2855]|nr:hypothetical protein [Microbacteriaceae bacterium VKM Ac-2855]